jgi:hypothetical protein
MFSYLNVSRFCNDYVLVKYFICLCFLRSICSLQMICNYVLAPWPSTQEKVVPRLNLVDDHWHKRSTCVSLHSHLRRREIRKWLRSSTFWAFSPETVKAKWRPVGPKWGLGSGQLITWPRVLTDELWSRPQVEPQSSHHSSPPPTAASHANLTFAWVINNALTIKDWLWVICSPGLSGHWVQVVISADLAAASWLFFCRALDWVGLACLMVEPDVPARSS